MSLYANPDPFARAVAAADNRSLSDQKKLSVSKASREKQAVLDPGWVDVQIGDDAVLDRDTVDVGLDKPGRFDFGQEGRAVNAFETSKNAEYYQDEGHRKQLDDQRAVIAKRLGIDLAEVTDDMVTMVGDQQKREFIQRLQEGYTPEEGGPAYPPMQYKVHGRGAHGRPLIEMRRMDGSNVTGIDNPEYMDAGYDTKYNEADRLAEFDARAKADKTSSYTPGEFAQDVAGTGLAAATGLVSSGYGLLNVANDLVRKPLNMALDAVGVDYEIPSIDQAIEAGTGESIAGRLQRTSEIIRSEMLSDNLTQQNRRRAISGEKVRLDQESKDKLREATGLNKSIADEVMDWGERVANAIGSFAENPGSLLFETGASAHTILLGGVAGAAAKQAFVKTATAGMTAKESAAYIASSAGQKAINQVATRTGVAVAGGTEGGAAFTQMYATVMDTSIEDLTENSSEFRAILKEPGMTPEKAKRQLAGSAALTHGITTGLAAGAVSKISGAGKFEGNLMGTFRQRLAIKPDSGFMRTMVNKLNNTFIGRAKTGAVKEAVDESFQNMAGQISENITTQKYLDEKRALGFNTAEAFGEGLAVGAASGATAGGQMAGAQGIVNTVNAAGPLVKKAKDLLTGGRGSQTKQLTVAQEAEAKQAVIDGDVRKATNLMAAMVTPETVKESHVADIAQVLDQTTAALADPATPSENRAALEEVLIDANALKTAATDMLKTKQEEEAAAEEAAKPTPSPKISTEQRNDAAMVEAAPEDMGTVEATKSIIDAVDTTAGPIADRDRLQAHLDRTREELKGATTKQEKALLTESRDTLVAKIDEFDAKNPNAPKAPEPEKTAAQQAAKNNAEKTAQKQTKKQIKRVDKLLAAKEVNPVAVQKAILQALNNPLVKGQERKVLQQRLQSNNKTLAYAQADAETEAATTTSRIDRTRANNRIKSIKNQIDAAKNYARAVRKSKSVASQNAAIQAQADLKDPARDKKKDNTRVAAIVNGIPVLGSAPEGMFEDIANSDASPELKAAAKDTESIQKTVADIQKNPDTPTAKFFKDVVKDIESTEILDPISHMGAGGHVAAIKGALAENDTETVGKHYEQLDYWTGQHALKISMLEEFNKTAEPGDVLNFIWRDRKGNKTKFTQVNQGKTKGYINQLKKEQKLMDQVHSLASNLILANDPKADLDAMIADNRNAETEAALTPLATDTQEAEEQPPVSAYEDEAPESDTNTPPVTENAQNQATEAPTLTDTTNPTDQIRELVAVVEGLDPETITDFLLKGRVKAFQKGVANNDPVDQRSIASLHVDLKAYLFPATAEEQAAATAEDEAPAAVAPDLTQPPSDGAVNNPLVTRLTEPPVDSATGTAKQLTKQVQEMIDGVDALTVSDSVLGRLIVSYRQQTKGLGEQTDIGFTELRELHASLAYDEYSIGPAADITTMIGPGVDINVADNKGERKTSATSTLDSNGKFEYLTQKGKQAKYPLLWKPDMTITGITDGVKEVYTPPGQQEEVVAPVEETVNIWAGSNENTELSNLSPRSFTYEGREYRSVEHAYQSNKSGAFNESLYNKYLKSNRAKITDGVREDRNITDELMRDIIKASLVQNPDVAKKVVDLADKNVTHKGGSTDHWTTEFPKIMKEMAVDPEVVAAANEEKVQLPDTGKYTAKDQAKSDKANKFIGRGSDRSSTGKYAEAWGANANTGEYTEDDVVFVSAEGGRKGRIPVDTAELQKATDAGATIITDVEAQRNTQYNVGEREVAAFLEGAGYTETSPGTWNKSEEVPLNDEEGTLDFDDDPGFTDEQIEAGQLTFDEIEQVDDPGIDFDSNAGDSDSHIEPGDVPSTPGAENKEDDVAEGSITSFNKKPNETADTSDLGKDNYAKIDIGVMIALLEGFVDSNRFRPGKVAADLKLLKEAQIITDRNAKMSRKTARRVNAIRNDKEYNKIIYSQFQYTGPIGASGIEALNALQAFASEMRTSNEQQEDRDELISKARTENWSENEVKEAMHAYYVKHGFPTAGDMYLNNGVELDRFGNLMYDKAGKQIVDAKGKPVLYNTSRIAKLKETYRTQKQKVRSLFGAIPNLLTVARTQEGLIGLYKILGIDQDGAALEKWQLIQDFRDDFANAYEKIIKPFELREGSNRFLTMHVSELDKDPFILFRDAYGYLPENIVSAMAVAGQNWIGTRGLGQIYAPMAAVNKMLGNAFEHTLSNEAMAELQTKGFLMATVAQDLGKSIRESLNLTTTDDIDGHLLSRLDIALGEATLNTMVKQGLLTRYAANNGELDKFRTDEAKAATANKKADIVFISPKLEWDETETYRQPIKAVRDNQEVVKALKDILSTFFNLESNERAPSDEPITEAPTQVGRTLFEVAKQMAKNILSQGQHAWVGKGRMLEKAQLFDSTTLAVMFGYEPNETQRHVTQAATLEGQNKTIHDDLSKIFGYFEERDPDKEFYFGYNIWKVLRSGLNSNVLNPQGSKITRHFIAAKDFIANINMGNPNEKLAFELAIAAAFGIGVDKMADGDAIDLLYQKVLNKDGTIREPYLAAVEILARDNELEITPADQAIVAAAVAAGGEKAYSFDGLFALAAYYNAPTDENNNKQFTMDLFREIDGITNGVVSGLLQLPFDVSRVTNRLQQGGIHPAAAQVNKHSDWSSIKQNLDAYQELTRSTLVEMDRLRAIINDPESEDESDLGALLRNPDYEEKGFTPNDVFMALDGRMEPFVDKDGEITSAGRKFSKNPLMISSYSAGAAKILAEYRVTVLDDFYTDITKAQDNPDALRMILANMNTILANNSTSTDYLDVDSAGKIYYPNNAEMETMSAQQFVLPAEFASHYQSMMGGYYGDSQGAAIKSLLAVYNENRNYLTNAVRVINTTAKVLFEERVAEREKALGGTILSPRDREKILLEMRDLGLLPGIRHATSESFKDLMPVYGVETVSVPTEEGGEVIQYYAPDSIETTRINIGGVNAQETVSQSKANVTIKTLTDDTGSAAMVGAIQSVDGNTASRSMGEFPVLNIHDAIATNAVGAAGHGMTVNQIYLELHEGWSLSEAVLETSARFLEAYNGMGTTQKEKVKAILRKTDNPLKQDFIEVDEPAFIHGQMRRTHEMFMANRAEIFEKMGLVSQYNDDRSGYVANGGEPVLNTTGKLSTTQQISKFMTDLFNYDAVLYQQTLTQGHPNLQNYPAAAKQTSEELFNYLKTRPAFSWAIKTFEEAVHPIGEHVFKEFLNSPQMVQEFISLFEQALPESVFDNTVTSVIEDEIIDQVGSVTYGQEVGNIVGSVEVALSKMGFYLPTNRIQRTGDMINYLSSPEGAPLRGGEAKPLTRHTSNELFNDLENRGNVQDSPEHKAHLNTMLDSLINPALDAANDLYLRVTSTQTGTRGELEDNNIYIAVADGEAKTNSEMSPQAVMVHELIHAVWGSTINEHQWVRRELMNLLKVAKKELDPNDLVPADLRGTLAEEQAAAKLFYDYMFNNGATGLHEFATHGLSTENIANAFKTVRYKSKDVNNPFTGSLWDRLNEVFKRATNWLSSVYYGTRNKTVDQALLALAKKSMAIKTNNDSRLANYTASVNTFVSESWKNWILEPISKITFDPYAVRGLAGNVLEATVKVTQAVNVGTMKKAIDSAYYRFDLSKDTFFYKLFTEMSGPTDITKPYHHLLRKSRHTIDSAKESMYDSVSKQVDQAYITPLTEDESMAVTAVFGKADISSVVQGNTQAGLLKLLTDRGYREREIRTIEKELETNHANEAGFYKIQAHSLGAVMARGTAGLRHQLVNAYAIARLVGTGKQAKGSVTAAEALIDQLASYHALNYTDPDAMATVADIVERENDSNATDNGITFTLGLFDHFKAVSLDRLFNGNRMQTLKGFTAELYDPNTTFRVGFDEDKESMRQQGYGLVKTIDQDRHDPNAGDQKYLFVSKQGLSRRWMAGITSLTARTHRGTDQTQAYHQETNVDYGLARVMGTQDRAITERRNKRDIAEQFAGTARLDFDKNYLVPSFNDVGGIANYRYLMGEETKKVHMGKKDEVGKVLGRMMSQMVDKENTVKINKELVALTYNDFNQWSDITPKEFVYVGLDSPKQKHREFYQMLPEDMRKEIRRVWGETGLHVREDQLDLIFGYRKLALTDYLDDKFLKASGKQLYPDMKNVMRLSGLIWTQVVSRAKRNVVILNPAVVTANTISNTVLLMTKGVNPVAALADQFAGIRAITKYQSDVTKRDRIQRRQDVGAPVTAAELNELRRLNEEVRTNPVAPLVDAGLFQSIIEDVNVDELNIADPLMEVLPPLKSAQAFIDERTQTGVSKVVKDSVVKGYKYAVISPDTQMGQLLFKATQYSDFVARYALYKNRVNNGISPEDAIDEVIDTFVNYDLPTSAQIQWINDMGIIMYTKFLLRIQRVILQQTRERPANVLALVALQRMTEDVPDIIDSNIITSLGLNRVNDPFDVMDDAFVFNLLNFIPFF